MQSAFVTDIGKVRKINEDSGEVKINQGFGYAIVADGMGGHEAGEVASKMAVDIINEQLAKNLSDGISCSQAGEIVREAFAKANSEIYEYAQNNHKLMGMGTTTTLAMIYHENIIVAHVGDSRAYEIDEKEIRQITHDHSYVQELVDRGEITPERAKHHPKKNFITRAMGTEDIVKIDITIKEYEGEVLLVCSDGLINLVEDNEIFDEINNNDLEAGLHSLVDLANERGGRDNITVAAIKSEGVRR